MKDIRVSEEEYKQLMEIAHELNTQDNRGTGPHPIWFLFDKQKIPTSSAYSDKYYWSNTGGDSQESEEEIQQLLKNKTDDFTKEYRKAEKQFELMYKNKDELHERVLNYMGYEQVFYIEVATRPKGVFFTEKACKAWAKANKHHLSDQAYNFVSSLWRNPEMQLIRKILLTLKGRIYHVKGTRDSKIGGKKGKGE